MAAGDTMTIYTGMHELVWRADNITQAAGRLQSVHSCRAMPAAPLASRTLHFAGTSRTAPSLEKLQLW